MAARDQQDQRRVGEPFFFQIHASDMATQVVHTVGWDVPSHAQCLCCGQAHQQRTHQPRSPRHANSPKVRGRHLSRGHHLFDDRQNCLQMRAAGQFWIDAAEFRVNFILRYGFNRCNITPLIHQSDRRVVARGFNAQNQFSHVALPTIERALPLKLHRCVRSLRGCSYN